MDLAKYLLHAKWSKYVSNNNDGDYQIKCIPERVKDTRKTLLKTTAILEGEWTSLKKQNKKKQEWFLSMGWASRLVLENGGGVGGQSNQAMHVCYLTWLKLTLPQRLEDSTVSPLTIPHEKRLPGLWESHSWVVKLAKEARWRLMS